MLNPIAHGQTSNHSMQRVAFGRRRGLQRDCRLWATSDSLSIMTPDHWQPNSAELSEPPNEMQDRRVSLSKRHEITAGMRLAETALYRKAEVSLSPPRYEELNATKGGALFIAGNYPESDCESLVGFLPDNKCSVK